MEKYREDMVVIFAGYPEKMDEFLNKNPGLRSRIAFHIPFNDYTPSELYDILELMAANRDMKLVDDVKTKVLPMFERAIKQENFGNGRYVRNLFEKARQKQASRLVHMDIDSVTNDDVQTLTPDDFETPIDNLPTKQVIGFN